MACGGDDGDGDDPLPLTRIAEVPIPPLYGIHDTFVRDGIAFVCAWNTGVIIYDVGNGVQGGSPAHPVEVSRYLPPAGNGSGFAGAIHNAWWYHAPGGERRYLFLGQEGPGTIGASSSGDIYVLDVSDLTAPSLVAQFSLPGAGTHNFWIDEPAQVLYAAYYNAGVIALDISGTLSGNLSSRVLAQVQPGGGEGTFTWGVQVANGSVYALDMLSGLWQLDLASGGLSPRGGSSNVNDRYSSDLWVHGDVAYTGTWGTRFDQEGRRHPGETIYVWSLGTNGAPTLASSVTVPATTVSDLQVTDDGRLLVATLENGAGAGFEVYSLASPLSPLRVGGVAVPNGLHTGTLAEIDGRLYLFAAHNPPDPSLMVFDLTGLGA